MTVPRAIVLLCVAAALASGAVLEALGLAVFVGVLFVARPDPRGRRPRGVRFRWYGGGWRQQ